EFRSSVSAGGAGWKITATGNYLGHKLLFAPRSAGATWETEVLTLTQNGNVGIGTTNPKTKFEISEGGDNIRIFANSMITDNVYYSGGWKNDNTGEGSATMQFDDGKFTFYTREAGAAEGMGTEKVTILSSGNVGIGTTSPAEKLEISNGNLKLTRTTSGGKEGMVIMSSAVAKSACDATTAGAIAYEVTGGGGTNSHFFGCRVDATGAYQWVQLDN
ncbi:MAG: hypothetical protein Q7J54_04540, partial [Candidatus Woesearchaeota archaeon]|nr:hypothetical protein [Candidatus Woesearchaeota archaeon]